MTAHAYVQQWSLTRLTEGVRIFASDVVGGCVFITHNSLALLGVAVAIAAGLVASQTDLRHQAETRLMAWLDPGHTPPPPLQTALPGPASVMAATAPVATEQTAVSRATAVNPQALPREQARLALWIARKYQVAPEPIAALVAGAYKAGRASHIDPALILSVMAVESSFNPFAQSTAGAQGLMQVMTRVHGEKYDGYGGNYAAFDPLSNLSVGVWVLRDCIDKTGSTADGLRCYVGATQLKTDGGYVNKVLAEYARLQQVVVQAGGMKYPSPISDPPASSPLSGQTTQVTNKLRANPAAVVAALAQMN